jgi:hypothetical protein
LKRPTVRLLLLFALVLAALAATAGAASAKKPCGQQVIDDWYGSQTGQLSRIYPIRCYRDALKIVSHETDLEVYSNAKQDIQAAMQLALAAGSGKKNGGPGGPSASGGPGGPGTPSGGGNQTVLPSFLGGPDKKDGGHPPASTVPQQIKKRPDPGPIPNVLHSSSASSVPVPAIVLGGVAALLLALGLAAYLARRRQQRRQTFRPRHANGRNPS